MFLASRSRMSFWLKSISVCFCHHLFYRCGKHYATMDVATTELKHSPGSLAGMTTKELRCLATRKRVNVRGNGIFLKRWKLIERISESSRRERSGTQLLPSLFAAQKTRKVGEADDSAVFCRFLQNPRHIIRDTT